jgi:hypothetical protein
VSVMCLTHLASAAVSCVVPSSIMNQLACGDRMYGGEALSLYVIRGHSKTHSTMHNVA